MQIHGLQKLTLLDYPEKVACTIFTAGCNFRCPFCHNASLVTGIRREQEIPEAEVLTFLKKRRHLLDGVCITGGEPLLQSDLEAFIRQVKVLGYEVKLDTNGSFPDKLIHLVEEGLVDYVAMDLKNSKRRYQETIGVPGYRLEQIQRSIDFLLSGKVPYEFRTTVVRQLHQRIDFEAMGEWIQGAEKYYLQTFEDSGDLIREGFSAYNEDIMQQALEIIRQFVPNAELRGIEEK